MSYQIITDSCCDFTQEQLDALQVTCANLTVLYNGENHSNFSEPAAVKNKDYIVNDSISGDTIF